MLQNSRDEEPNDDPHLQGESVEPDALAIKYSWLLYLGYSTASLASRIADAADTMLSDWYCTPESIAAASVYIASHILDQPRDLTEVERVARVSELRVYRVYRAIHYNRYNLVDVDWRRYVGGTVLAEAAEALPSLTWPPLQHDFIDIEDEDEEPTELVNNNRASAIGGLELVKELCINFYTNRDDHRDIDPNSRVLRIAHKLADQMETLRINWGTVNPCTIAAACTYMSSHLNLLGRRKTFREVSLMSGVPSARIRNTYGVMYRFREQIVPEDWSEGVFARGVSLSCLPRP